jgi:hypothetical protein
VGGSDLGFSDGESSAAHFDWVVGRDQLSLVQGEIEKSDDPIETVGDESSAALFEFEVGGFELFAVREQIEIARGRFITDQRGFAVDHFQIENVGARFEIAGDGIESVHDESSVGG